MNNDDIQNLKLITAANDNATFADDLLRGAEAISEWLLGSRKMRRKIYHLVATSNLPVFKLGSLICARKSRLTEWVVAQETRRVSNNPKKTTQ